MESLNKAQQEINRVLELLGRIFVATKSPGDTAVIAATTRLKQALPASIRKYHNALDELDSRLHFARTVMQQELALATKEPEKDQKVDTYDVSSESQVNEPDADVKLKSEASEDAADTQVVANDLDQAAVKEAAADTVIEAKPATIADDVHMADEPESAQPLKLDTKPDMSHLNGVIDLDKAPDTTTSNNADMDSLFNDPVSATDRENAEAPFDFDKIPTSNGDFDFDAFSAGLGANDTNVSTEPLVLPDFTTDGDEPDFSALFGTSDQPVLTDAQVQPSQGDTQEFNFDDIMDFSVPETNIEGAGDGGNDDFQIDFS